LLQEDAIAAFNFEIRTRDDAARMIPTIRRELQLLDRNLKISSLESARVLMRQSISGERSIAQLSGLFGVLALVLAAAGLYGVMSYATSRRANEIGLRMALGADRRHIIRMVLRETLMLLAGGFAIGLPTAMAATRLTAGTLAGVSASDPATVGGATLVLLIVGVCAGFVPAQRASRIDPMSALRQE
jgi:ABC-type antimicrobial peptide transport system permease subunit